MNASVIIDTERVDVTRAGVASSAALVAALLAIVGVTALIAEPAAPRARIPDPAATNVVARSLPVLPAAAPERPDRLFIALPLGEIRLRTGAFPLALPSDAGILVRSGWEGPFGPDRWFRAAGVLLDYRVGSASLTLIARQESAARSRTGTPVVVRNTNGVAQQRAELWLVAWSEGDQRYELASRDLDVAALVRLAATLTAEP